MVVCGSFIVDTTIDPAQVTVQCREFSEFNGPENPQQVDPNTEMFVEVQVQNNNQNAVDVEPTFRVNGEIIDQFPMSLAGNSSEITQTTFNVNEVGLLPGDSFTLAVDKGTVSAATIVPEGSGLIGASGRGCSCCGSSRKGVAERLRSSARGGGGVGVATVAAAAPIGAHQSDLLVETCDLQDDEVGPGGALDIQYGIPPEANETRGDVVVTIVDDDGAEVSSEIVRTVEVPPRSVRQSNLTFTDTFTAPTASGTYQADITVANERLP